MHEAHLGCAFFIAINAQKALRIDDASGSIPALDACPGYRTVALYSRTSFFGELSILAVLINIAMRMPRLAIGALMLALITLAGTSTYAGYLVVGMLADYLGSGRFVAGLLLAVLFVRLPYVREGKVLTRGMLPKKARLPLVLALLAACLVLQVEQRDAVAGLFVGLAATFLLTYRWLRQALANRVSSLFARPSPPPAAAHDADPTIIDVDFREKKD